MGSKFGYAYRYELWMDDEIMRPDELPEFESIKRKDSKFFFFKFRTEFTVEDEHGSTAAVVGSERYHFSLTKEAGDACLLFWLTGSRLYEEYWMPPREAHSLCVSAVDFARKKEADHPHLDVIPVFVEIKVCTVQKAGEPIALTFERAIKPDRLCPLYLNIYSLLPCAVSPALVSYLKLQPRTRVESVRQGSTLMEVCSICSRGPTIGDQISRFKCGHAFHSHCAVKWLERSQLCPSCNAEEHEFWIPNINTDAEEESLSCLSVS